MCSIAVIKTRLNSENLNRIEIDSEKILTIAERHQYQPRSSIKKNWRRGKINVINIQCDDCCGNDILNQIKDPDSKNLLIISGKHNDCDGTRINLASENFILFNENESVPLSNELNHFLNNGNPVHPAITGSIIETITKTEENNRKIFKKLTQKEIEIMKPISRGLTVRKSAEFLKLKYNTVKNRLRIIYKKLGANNRGEAIYFFKQMITIILLQIILNPDLFVFADPDFLPL